MEMSVEINFRIGLCVCTYMSKYLSINSLALTDTISGLLSNEIGRTIIAIPPGANN